MREKNRKVRLRVLALAAGAMAVGLVGCARFEAGANAGAGGGFDAGQDGRAGILAAPPGAGQGGTNDTAVTGRQLAQLQPGGLPRTGDAIASDAGFTGPGSGGTGGASGTGLTNGTGGAGGSGAGAPPPPIDPARAQQEWDAVTATVLAMDAGDVAGKLDALMRELDSSQYMWRNVPRGSQPGGPNFRGNGYDLDGNRTAQQILSAGVGGSCGSYGKVLADALVRSGTSPDDVFLVDTVGESRRGDATAAAASGDSDASGHQFLLVRDRTRGWLLVNTTSPTLEAIPFTPPAELQGRLARTGYAADPVRIDPRTGGAGGGPAFAGLTSRTERDQAGNPIQVGPPPEIFNDLVVFQVARSVDYREHTIADRVRAVARVVPR